MNRVVVVGASLAGLRAVQTLRREGYAGDLTLIGDEPHVPYDRPPLSKQLLSGDWNEEQVYLCSGAVDFDDLQLDARLGLRAEALELGDRAVVLEDDSRVGFDGLIIATGAKARTLPGVDLEGIHVLRTLDDCRALRADLEVHDRLAVIGAGFIGLEVASTARARGLDVTVIEAQPVPLGHALGPEIGAACLELHRSNGVDMRCGVTVARFEGDRRVERIVLSDDTTMDVGLVVVGVGVSPETGWLESSGIELDNGVVCDETCATSVPGVYAAGDVARWYNPLFGEHMRVEHWTNAAEQGTAAARALLAGPEAAEPFAPVPFFWSDQHSAKIQSVGRCRADAEVQVVHGSLDDGKFVAIYGSGGRLTGALAFSWPRLLMEYRTLLTQRASWDDAVAHAASLN